MRGMKVFNGESEIVFDSVEYDWNEKKATMSFLLLINKYNDYLLHVINLRCIRMYIHRPKRNN